MGAQLGYTVGTAGDVNCDGYSDVLVTAPSYDNGQVDEGAVFLFYGSANGLASTVSWSVESNQERGYFGNQATTAGDVNSDGCSDIIVGAYQYEDESITCEGAAFAYYGSPNGFSAPGTPSNANWMVKGNQPLVFMGTAVGTAGDVNGDGYSDVIVSAPDYDHPEYGEGMVFVYHGGASGLSTTAAWTVETNIEDAEFGNSVGTAGDVNGDGYSDVIISSYSDVSGPAKILSALVYYGSATGIKGPDTAGTADWSMDGVEATVGTAGDVNGDGYSDIIIGVHLYSNGTVFSEGAAFVFHGSANGVNNGVNGTRTNAAWMAESLQGGAYLGNSGTAGDVNGDGYADVIIGAYKYDNGQTDEGGAFVYYGSTNGVNNDVTGTPTNAAWSAESDQAGAGFGWGVGTAGDVNGDGFSDIIVGAYDYDNGQTDEGKAYVYHGEAAKGLATGAGWTVVNNHRGSFFGYSLGTAGDVNGDGYADILVSAGGETLLGSVYVHYGSASGPEMTPGTTLHGDLSGSGFGISAGTAGDVNGDGYSDVIVGGNSYSNGEQYEGAAYLYLGSQDGLSTTPAWKVEGKPGDGESRLACGDSR